MNAVKEALTKLDEEINEIEKRRAKFLGMTEWLTPVIAQLEDFEPTSISINQGNTVFIHVSYRRTAKQMAPIIDKLSGSCAELPIDKWDSTVNTDCTLFTCWGTELDFCVILAATDMGGCVLVPRGKKTIMQYSTVEVDDFAVLCPEEV